MDFKSSPPQTRPLFYHDDFEICQQRYILTLKPKRVKTFNAIQEDNISKYISILIEGLPLNFWNNSFFKNKLIHFRISSPKINTCKEKVPLQLVLLLQGSAKSNHCAIWFDKVREPKSSHSSNSFLSPSVNSLQIIMVGIQNLTNLGIKPHSIAQLTPC